MDLRPPDAYQPGRISLGHRAIPTTQYDRLSDCFTQHYAKCLDRYEV